MWTTLFRGPIQVSMIRVWIETRQGIGTVEDVTGIAGPEGYIMASRSCMQQKLTGQ